MKLLTMCVAFSAVVAVSLAFGQTPAPQPVLPDTLKWFSPPNNPMARGAWMIGGEKEVGSYIFRVMLAKGGKLPVHTHPDSRNTTVLSVTLYVGFGETFDESKVVAVPAGGIYVAPANVPHYLWAKDGDVTYQEGGVGPTATVPLRQ